MAYQEYTITSLADIPSLVEGFATTLGWDVGSGCVLRHPNYNGGGPGGLAFQLTSSVPTTEDAELNWICTTDPLRSAGIRSPVFATDAAPTVPIIQTPTKLFLIGMLAPEPYLAIVVEYGYNLYRHLYIGYMEKQGIYDGGMVVASVNGPSRRVNGDIYHVDNRRGNFLFRGHTDDEWGDMPERLAGGVQIEAAENAYPWRKFYDGNRSVGGFMGDADIATGMEVYGGYGDGINDRYVAKGRSRIAGAVILTPNNLYMTRLITDNFRLRGIGRPTGVRMVNLVDLEPQAQFSVGADNYYSFAARSKQADLYSRVAGTGGSNRYRKNESSYYLGYAYRG